MIALKIQNYHRVFIGDHDQFTFCIPAEIDEFQSIKVLSYPSIPQYF